MTHRMLDRHFNRIMKGRELQHLATNGDIICVDVTPSARWFIEESDQEYWDYDADLPCALPPWPFAWLEYNAIGLVEKCSGKEIDSTIRSIGLLAETKEIPDNLRESTLWHDPIIKMMGDNLDVSKEQLKIRRLNIEKLIQEKRVPRWISFFVLLIETSRGVHPVYQERMYFDEMGQALATVRCGMSPGGQALSERKQEITRLGIQAQLLPFLFSFSLLHCKNVYLETCSQPRRYARKKRKQKNAGSVIYKTLVIDPMKKQVRRESSGHKRNPIQQALHIVRGHFKDYRDGAGLFGKYKDIYWWGMYAKGKEKHGKIEKDYLVLGKKKRTRKRRH